jgi:FtsH-binding integral membrane protein
MYVLPLAIVVGIVYWLASNVTALLLAHVIDPSLRRAYREDGTRNRRGYLRSIAAANALALAATTAALYATCDFYAQNNRPAWPAWAVFAIAFVALLARPLLASAASVVRASRLPG